MKILVDVFSSMTVSPPADKTKQKQKKTSTYQQKSSFIFTFIDVDHT